jgi:hypothetical protein
MAYPAGFVNYKKIGYEGFSSPWDKGRLGEVTLRQYIIIITPPTPLILRGVIFKVS